MRNAGVFWLACAVVTAIAEDSADTIVIPDVPSTIKSLTTSKTPIEFVKPDDYVLDSSSKLEELMKQLGSGDLPGDVEDANFVALRAPGSQAWGASLGILSDTWSSLAGRGSLRVLADCGGPMASASCRDVLLPDAGDDEKAKLPKSMDV